MATWSSATDATVGDRLLNVGGCAKHLSDGALVFLEYDPGATAPNQVTLMLAANHTSTPVVVAYISSDNFSVSGVPQALDLITDDDDNLYVLGQDTGLVDHFGVQAFTKQSGHVWTQGAYIRKGPSQLNGFDLNGFASVWCNTGGTSGAGLIVSIFDDTTGNDWCMVLDAGLALQSNPDDIVATITKNPAFLGGAGINTGSNLDISTDGFGASTGIAISGTTTTSVTVASWGVTSKGSLTTGGGLLDTETCGTLSATTKCKIVRQSPNLWVAFYRSTGTPTQLTARTYSGSAKLGVVLALGTPGNFPSTAALSWAAIAAQTTPTSLAWVFGWSTQAGRFG